MQTANTIESASQFKDDPQGEAERWAAEMVAADKEVEKWTKEGRKIVDRFIDKRSNSQSTRDYTRLNLFSTNIQTIRAMLYGQVPSVDVKRRHDDYRDDEGRVAATMLQRLLNNDMEREDDGYTDALRYALDDRLLPGLGVCRVRYEAEFDEVEVPPQMGHRMPDGSVMPGEMPGAEPVVLADGYTEEQKVWEDAATDYIHWDDVRWSPARVWSEVRWIAFREFLTKDQMKARFGEDIAKTVPYGTQKRKNRQGNDALEFDAWQRCEVWEIWCKTEKKVYWWVKNYSRILDTKDDPLELTNFFPCPKFLVANCTTSSLVPTPDYHLHKDLYNEIDYVSTRIEKLERAVKAVGVYDKAATGVQRMLTEGTDNDLIPVDNWALFGEKGGLQGTVQWMPLADIVGAMDKLREYRKELIDLLYQVSGMSDIMRGASTQPNVTATEQGLKARFASVRINALQDEFAEFASELQRLRAEVIVKHFDDETIVARSGIALTPDAQMIGPALELLRSRFLDYRIEIEPDSIARADYAALKNDRVEYVTAIGQFIAQVLPLAEKSQEAAVPLVEIIKWVSTGFRGGRQMEGVLDQALDGLVQSQKQQQGQQQPPPEVQVEQLRQQAEQAKAQLRIREAQMKAAGKMQEIAAKQQADMQKLQAEQAMELQKIEAELQADIRREAAQARFNVIENREKEAGSVEADAMKARFAQPKGQ